MQVLWQGRMLRVDDVLLDKLVGLLFERSTALALRGQVVVTHSR